MEEKVANALLNFMLRNVTLAFISFSVPVSAVNPVAFILTYHIIGAIFFLLECHDHAVPSLRLSF